jgi:recombination protein RecT
MSTALEPRDAARDLANIVRADQFKQQVAIALPEGVNPDRFVRVMATALLDNPDIAVKADINSVFQAGLKAAQDGLMPDGREAAFVLFGNQCVYLSMVGGLRKIAAEFGWSIRSAVVYANDRFEVTLGMDATLVHIPVRPGAERGVKIAAYAVGAHKDGRKEFEVMTAAEVAQVRKVSRASDRGPWVQWEDQMWEKSAARRLFKKLPLDEADKARIDRVLAADLPAGEAARTMYGEDRTQLPQIPPAPSTPGATEEGVGATGGEEHSPDDAPAAAAPPAEPDFDGEEPAEASTFEPPASVRDQAAPSQTELAASGAGDVTFSSGRYSGKTLQQVLDSGDKGRDYLKWAAASWKTEPLKSAIHTYLASAASELMPS